MNSDQLFSIAGKLIVLTGGLGKLGQVLSHGLQQLGASVAIIDSQVSSDQLSQHFSTIRADITRRDDVERALDIMLDVMGTPSGLINNAGIDSPPDACIADNGPFEHVSAASFNRVINVNVTGAMICCQVIGAAMKKGSGGAIVNIGSIYDEVSPDQRLYEFRRQRGDLFYKPAAYGASKAALHNLTKYLSVYWSDIGIRTNTLCFGGFKFDQPGEFSRAYQARVPMRRMADPAEALGPTVFLLSAASSYMTGARLLVDGGFLAL